MLFSVRTTAWLGSIHCPCIEYESKAKTEWILDLLVYKKQSVRNFFGATQAKNTNEGGKIMNKIVVILLVGLLGFFGCSDNDGKTSTVTGADKIASFQSKHKPMFDVNEKGQVVWTLKSNESTSLYFFGNNNTKLIRNTPSSIVNLWIKDTGEVSWIEFDLNELVQNESAQNGFVIYTYKDGKTSNVPIEDVPVGLHIQMNANGTVVWAGSGDNDSLQIYKYENGSIEQMTSENNNLLPQINDAGDITWVELVGETAYITFLSRNGVLYTRINEQRIDMSEKNDIVDMNENGDLVWSGANDSSNLNQVFLFKDGTTKQITGGVKECLNPQINDKGHIVYHAADDNTNEIEIFGVDSEIRSIIRANKYLSPPQINNDGFILWELVDNDDYSFLLRDENNDIVKTLFKSTQGYFDSGLFFADDRYACFLDGELVEDEFEYNSLYLFDLNDFHSLTDSVLKPFQDEKHALAKTDGLIEQIPTVSQDRDNIESLMPTTETIPPRDSNERWSFVVAADTRGIGPATVGLGDSLNVAGTDWLSTCIGHYLDPNPEIILFNGDMQSYMWYFLGIKKLDLKNWDHYFSRLGRDKVYPIKGNHEIFYSTVIGPYRKRSMQDHYRQALSNLKYNHVLSATGIHGIPDYNGLAYYFTHKNAFFVVFDSNYMAPDASCIHSHDISCVTQAQIDWFKNQVVNSPEYKNAKLRFALSHYTLYPSELAYGAKVLDKPNNVRLLEQIVKHNFDAYFGACEHLYTDRWHYTYDNKKYIMPTVTCGPMPRKSYDSKSKIVRPGAFNKIITKTPGFLRVNIYPGTFFIEFVTPTNYTWARYAGVQIVSSIKVGYNTDPPNIVDNGPYKAGTHIAVVPYR